MDSELIFPIRKGSAHWAVFRKQFSFFELLYMHLTNTSLLPLNTDARFSIQYLRTQCTRTSISLAGTLFIEQTSLVLIYTAFKGTRDDSFFIPLPTTVTVNTEDIFQKRVPHWGRAFPPLLSVSWRMKQPSPHLTTNIFLGNSPDHCIWVFNPSTSSLVQEKLHYISSRESNLKISSVQFQLC